MQHALMVEIIPGDMIAAASSGGDDDDKMMMMMMMMGGGTGILQLLSYLQAHAACSDGRDHSG